MKTKGYFGLLSITMALLALPAAVEARDGLTPAENPLCNEADFVTPGLYGLCVAMCEAQQCGAEYDPVTKTIKFDDNCKPSAEQILANYNRKAGPDDPQMPCVRIPCPCWTETELDNIGGGGINGTNFDSCLGQEGDSFAGLFGMSDNGGGAEWAYTSDDPAMGLLCTSMEATPSNSRTLTVSPDEFTICQQSVMRECVSRGK
ncbi:MAG: hypothetical protein JSU82_15410 [Rhodospirillales bacterium]|nr:MAG: hypothetical protein JSU82_15410 [Rhodospirillales bacterium]